MATTRIWSVRYSLERALNYASNPQKTERENLSFEERQVLHNVIDYAQDDVKTEKRYYVTGVNCAAETALSEMMTVKQAFGKTSGVLAFHGYQSFKPDETTPEQAHKIGVELAKRLWGDRFQVLVATHLNTKCLHNHFVLNSVSYTDGKKFYASIPTYRQMRSQSDEICHQFGLGVIENPKGRRAPYNIRSAQLNGKTTKGDLIKADVDEAVAGAFVFPDFIRNLEKLGYEVKTGNRKFMAIKPPFSCKFFRLKTLGEGYSEEDIKRRILENEMPVRMLTLTEPAAKATKLKGQFKNQRKVTGYRALYLHYCYKMGILPKHAKRSQRRTPFLLRQDLIHLDDITAQVQLICEHRIDTRDQLDAYRDSVIRQISALDEQVRKNRNRQRRCTDGDELLKLEAENAESKQKRLALKKEVRLCKSIEGRTERMKENLRTVNQNDKTDRKEIEKNEHERGS